MTWWATGAWATPCPPTTSTDYMVLMPTISLLTHFDGGWGSETLRLSANCKEERRGGSGWNQCRYSTEACTTLIPTTATSRARGHSTFRQGSKKYTSSLNSEEHQHIQLLLIRQKIKKIGGGVAMESGEKGAGQWEGNWDKGKRNYMARFYRAQLRGPITHGHSMQTIITWGQART